MPLIVKTTPAATRERTRVLLSNYRGMFGGEEEALRSLLVMVQAVPENDREALSRIFDAEMIAARLAEIAARKCRPSMAPWRGGGWGPPCATVTLLQHIEGDEGPLGWG